VGHHSEAELNRKFVEAAKLMNMGRKKIHPQTQPVCGHPPNQKRQTTQSYVGAWPRQTHSQPAAYHQHHKGAMQ
jgi:hypothetical protein